MTKQHLSIFRYVVVALFAVLCSALIFTACNPGNQYTVTWQVAEHATVSVDGYDGLPDKVNEGDTLVFSVSADEGYEIAEVLRNKVAVDPGADGKYSVKVSADTTIEVVVDRKITGISVTTKPTKLEYEAGQTVDRQGMVVKVIYADGSSEVKNDYRIRYQGSTTASAFALGDTFFTVWRDNVESDHVNLTKPAYARVTLDLGGATLKEEYLTALKAKFADAAVADGNLSFTYSTPLTDKVDLPTAAELEKGTDGDYQFLSWADANGQTVTAVAQENAVSVSYTSNWKNNLFDVESIAYELRQDVPYLVINGKLRGASVFVYFTEGQRKIAFGNSDSAISGTRGEEKELAFNMLDLINAKAQDGGNFIGPWLDLRIAHVREDGGIEDMDFRYDGVQNIDRNQSIFCTYDGADYRFAFAEYEGAIKAVVTMAAPYTYTMKVDNANDVLTLTFTGKITTSKFYGMKVKMDWWMDATIGPVLADIDAQGNWKVEFELSPDKGFKLDTLGYLHFSIVDVDGSTVLYKDGDDGNMLGNKDVLENIDELTQNNVPHKDFTGKSLRIANSDETLVYFVGIPNWDAIVIYGYNPSAKKATANGDIELKVDNFANPTKVYYVVEMTFENITGDEVYNVVLGNTDGEVKLYNSDKTLSTQLSENTYKLWFDITSHTGGMLWPNVYYPVEDGQYEMLCEVGGDGDHSTNGMYAIVGNVKYTILCTGDTAEGGVDATYNRPCVVLDTPKSGETNPEYVNPDYVKPEITATGADLEESEGKAYLVITGTAAGYQAAALQTALEAVQYDFQERGDDWTSFNTFTKTVAVDGNNWTIKIEITELPLHGNPYTCHFNGGDLKLSTEAAEDGATLHVGDKVFTLVNKAGSTAEADNWGCVSVKVEQYVDQTTPVYKATGYDISAEGGKVYFTISGTYSNYEEADLEGILQSIYFDLQKNSYINHNNSWDNGDWEEFDNTELSHTVTVSGGTWSIKIDITDMEALAYTVHFGQVPDGADKTKPGDLKIDDKTNHGKFAVAGEKRYVVYNYVGSTAPEHFYGCIGIVITDVSQKSYTFDVTTLNLVEEDGKVYLTIEGTCFGYTEEDFKMDLEENSTWTKFNTGAVTVTITNGKYIVKFDITDVNASENTYLIHLLVDTGSEDMYAYGGQSAGYVYHTVTANGKTYTLLVTNLWDQDRLTLDIKAAA